MSYVVYDLSSIWQAHSLVENMKILSYFLTQLAQFEIRHEGPLPNTAKNSQPASGA
jgi:hypothetical protein